MEIKVINTRERGLTMFIGALEAAVLKAIWAGNSTSAKIWRYVRDNYTPTKTVDEIAYTSVTSTLGRLFTQGYLTRTGDKNTGYSYTPVCATEQEFINLHIQLAVNALFNNYPREAGQAVVGLLRAIERVGTRAVRLEDQTSV
jgi:predicted transcriptional regulator